MINQLFLSVTYFCQDVGKPLCQYRGTVIDIFLCLDSADSKYNTACTAGMALEHFRMLIHELFNKDPDIFPEEDPLIVLDSKSSMCMTKNVKDTKHTMHIARIIHFLRNGEKCKMQNIDWCEGGMQLGDIATKNVC